MSLTLLERVEKGLQSGGNNIYTMFLQYFDLVGQVHSIVESKKGLIYLRVWFGDWIGPRNLKSKRIGSLFRINELSWKRYISPPDRKIGWAVDRIKPENCLLDINIFDEHILCAENLKSGDFVVITNIHYARTKSIDTFSLHGGTRYNRGIFQIPCDFQCKAFQKFKSSITKLADRLSYGQDEPFIEFPEISQLPENFEGEIQSGASPRNCIIGDMVAVDCFRKTDLCSYHFLTNAHSEHIQGLNSSWTSVVYCSQETAKILPLLTSKNGDDGINPELIIPLEVGKTHDFSDFRVTVIDANHCFGSVMFLFEGSFTPDGAVLCTGDFRADDEFLSRFETEEVYKKLSKTEIAEIYMDNIYFSVEKEIPSRQQALRILMEEVKKWPDSDILIPLHKLGKEELLVELSEELQEPIKLYSKKEDVVNLMNYNLKNGKINQKRQISVIEKEACLDLPATNFILFNISMVCIRVQSVFENIPKEKYFHIPYSDHSPRNEILNFLKRLIFKEVIPLCKYMPCAEVSLVNKLASK